MKQDQKSGCLGSWLTDYPGERKLELTFMISYKAGWAPLLSGVTCSCVCTHVFIIIVDILWNVKLWNNGLYSIRLPYVAWRWKWDYKRSAPVSNKSVLHLSVNSFPQGGWGESGIPSWFDIEYPPLGWEFVKSVFLQGRKDCKHWVDGTVELPYTYLPTLLVLPGVS